MQDFLILQHCQRLPRSHLHDAKALNAVDENGRRERKTSREHPIVHRSRRPLSLSDAPVAT